MKISIIGTGYVGLVTGTVFAEMGNDVICIDNDNEKIRKLIGGEIPIYEPGLSEMVKNNCDIGHLRFSTDISSALANSQICFIAVGTPSDEDGSADLHFVLDVARSIGKHMTHHMFVVDKSTVPVGTAELVRKEIQNELNIRKSDLTFDVISNPEFLKEGNAIADALRPDRIVIGADSEQAFSVMKELYKAMTLNTNAFSCMDIPSAEMTKYAANAMLATKISFINEIANICEKVGANVNSVRLGIGSDKRIGYSFIYPGCGYGGSCFPKDVKALIKTAKQNGYTTHILCAVEEVNQNQKRILVEKILNRFGNDLSGRKIAVWGLSFKPETDDMREATAIIVINELAKHGAVISAYDPKVTGEILEKHLYNKSFNVEKVKSKYSALNNADAMVLVTEWAEFRSPDYAEMRSRMKSAIIFDGRNQYDINKMREYGFEYHQIGVRNQ